MTVIDAIGFCLLHAECDTIFTASIQQLGMPK